MKKLIKITLSIVLVLTLLFTVILALPSETSTSTDDNSQSSPTEEKEDPVEVQGETFGEVDGALAGKKDFGNNQKCDYQSAMRGLGQLVGVYRLNLYKEADKRKFYEAYRKAFKSAYLESFSESTLKQNNGPAERGSVNGEKLGSAEGVYHADMDILNNVKSDWLRDYQLYIDQKSLTDRYQLQLQDPRYSEHFIVSFKAGFKTAYCERYQNETADQKLNGNVFQKVVYQKDCQIYDTEISDSQTAWLAIDKATVYQDTYLSLQRISNEVKLGDAECEPISGLYKVAINQSRQALKLYKPIELHFVYNDNPNIGVYQWVYNHWEYQQTKRNKDSVSIEIPAGQYNGGKYALFIDNGFVQPVDSVYSWAYSDIVLALRRDYLPNGLNFRPNQSMTRLELANLLYQMLRSRTGFQNREIAISDKIAFSGSEMAVQYALSSGYMQTDENAAFNPSHYVSYQEFSDIVKRVAKDENFDYADIANKMFYEHYTLSNYLTDKTANPTRAEILFTLNQYVN